jgi:hypothetical protein
VISKSLLLIYFTSRSPKKDRRKNETKLLTSGKVLFIFVGAYYIHTYIIYIYIHMLYASSFLDPLFPIPGMAAKLCVEVNSGTGDLKHRTGTS